MKSRIYNTLHFFVAVIWLINGLFCKLLNWVPRHREIVQRILPVDFLTAAMLTKTIGALEILMAIWIVSRIYRQINVIVQIVLIMSMNVLEFFLARDLLLWGKWNLLFAFLLIFVIGFNEFHFREQTKQSA